MLLLLLLPLLLPLLLLLPLVASMAADMRSIICCHKQNWSAIVAEVAVVERASGGSDAAGQPEVSDLSGSKFGEAADGSGGNEIRMKRRSEWYPSLSAPHLPATAGQPVVKLPRARSLIHTLSGPPVAVPGTGMPSSASYIVLRPGAASAGKLVQSTSLLT